ncbi:uncharacterized protein LOC123527735 [Mercenaria mercenaria]|uniref:uncharacterized protein LOC123527735 n=1 Tax=Mercenaria mercenaria TaxID=6596 RepID=UPI00234F420E|nr:uncharacterized protein LOC123527735 [Mercenaria mercenaria]XP_045163326.2 uncharacterized protein LOC123527735 [Mercenaria mercenaria]XP_045163332.2 uncharacterized protein LOC123527735 [Mercenaria mercenaria]
MATAIVPTEEKTNGFRLLSLVIDGGTLVLRHTFDQAIPPKTLCSKLADVEVRTKLNELKKTGKITADQWRLLYPQVGKPDSAKFDISLLTCLLHHICGLNEHSRSWQGIPSSMDISLEADIQKMRLWRNEMSHSKSMSFSDQTFLHKWSEIEQVILRLGKDIPTLRNDIHMLKESSIDPKREKYYQEKLKESNEIDTIRTKVTEIESNVQDIEQKLEGTNIQQQDIYLRQGNLEQKLTEDSVNRDVQQKSISERLSESETKANQLKESFAQLSQVTEDKIRRVSSKLDGLRSMTRLYVEDAHRDEVYVETSAHIKPKETLNKTHCLILSGLPGEGKTTMATKLISEVSHVNSVLKLREPSDWKHVDISKNQFDIIFIDDIFGAGSFDENLHQGWSKLLPEIEKAVSAKKISVIITTRHYILEEAREKMRRLHLFIDENVIVLDSTTLTSAERAQLLVKHLQHADKSCLPGFISQCNSVYDSSFSCTNYRYMPAHNFDTSTYIWGGKRIGFPEIVNIFANTDQLYKQGASFFEKPVAFFKGCMEDLFLEEDKYLALILIWCRPHQELQVNDLMSADIKTTINKFNFELKGELLKVLRKSLKYHSGGFLQFDSRSGKYSFCHNIVKDMVGLVAGQEYPEAVIEFANEEFIKQYVTTDKEKVDGFHLYIEEYRYECLRRKICADVTSSKYDRVYNLCAGSFRLRSTPIFLANI